MRSIIELETGWELIQKSISKLTRILDGAQESFDSDEYSMVFTSIYEMCTQKIPHRYSQQLYLRYKQAMEEYLLSTVLPALRDKHDEFMLRELVKKWKDHKVMVYWFSRFFIYLERYFIPRKKVPTLKAVGYDCFQELIFAEMKISMNDATFALINRDREGEHVDTGLLKDIVGILVEVGNGSLCYYETNFQKHLLLDAEAYYSRKAAFWIEEDSCSDYMIRAENYLRKEEKRAELYLHAGSKFDLLETIRCKLLLEYGKQLLPGCDALLRDGKVDDLSRIYRLYSSVSSASGLETISSIFKEHIDREGASLVKQANEDVNSKDKEEEFLLKIIEFHDKHLQYVSECFANQPLFHKALVEGFKTLFNNRQVVRGSTIAEVMVIVCDSLLKKGGCEKLNEEVIEDTLEKVIKLLQYIKDKDLFSEFYRKKLACRLLFDNCSNEEHERNMLTKLKHNYGKNYTYKMEGMLKDFTLARENRTLFEESLNENAMNINFTVTVLTTGYWPSYKFSNLALPSEMVKCVETFEGFYRTRTKKRKLTWITSLGNCNIIGKFESKDIELVVTTYQAAALLLFNEAESLRYTEIKDQLNLAKEDVMRVLSSLSCGKYRILNKEPNTKDVSESYIFTFNHQFTHKARRIKIPLPPLAVDVEKKKTLDDVNRGRRYAVDACIIRIMKKHKLLPYRQLVAECITQLERIFKPDIRLIKHCVDDLLIREFLERDKENSELFHYVA